MAWAILLFMSITLTPKAALKVQDLMKDPAQAGATGSNLQLVIVRTK